jgi:tetratricopeptide (TPR) repeat protein
MNRFLAVALLATSALAQVPEGDQAYARRAEGVQQVNAALGAYERAVAQNPNDLEGRWKLLRTYRFKGAYHSPTSEEKKKIYGLAKTAGEQAIAVVNRRLGAAAKGNDQQVAAAARAVPGAAEVLLWDAVNWGEWALAYGKLAAARQGAADRIRRGATIARIIDPRLEGGLPSRVLGRLHDQTPRIPFITGWASQREAVKFLRESLAIDPSNKITIVFLAEAMVAEDPDTKIEAVKILREALKAPNDPNFAVEQAAADADARALLKKWGA